MNFKYSIITSILVLFGLSFSTSLFAQSAEANFTVSKIVESSADEVWGLLRKMDDIDKYSSAISKVNWTGNKGVGGQRVCTTPDGQGYFKESIVKFDDNARTYSYALIEGVPTKGMVNNFKVLDLGYKKSMIVWTSSYEKFIENPQMTEAQFAGFINSSINEMIDNIVAETKKS
ncbi:MAG: SRPBCC family protein [Bacteroidota bacterium]